ncbi:hypothetical protein AWV80_05695 [Cupriavidus sp. UYMU48A]|nr:hypothetical protein AWV80_05695 [Cupriavidus sp. UYMU48A]
MPNQERCQFLSVVAFGTAHHEEVCLAWRHFQIQCVQPSREPAPLDMVVIDGTLQMSYILHAAIAASIPAVFRWKFRFRFCTFRAIRWGAIP